DGAPARWGGRTGDGPAGPAAPPRGLARRVADPCEEGIGLERARIGDQHHEISVPRAAREPRRHFLARDLLTARELRHPERLRVESAHCEHRDACAALLLAASPDHAVRY